MSVDFSVKSDDIVDNYEVRESLVIPVKSGLSGASGQTGSIVFNSANDVVYFGNNETLAPIGSLSGTTLQNSYDGSSNPEVVVDSTRGAVSIRDNAVPIGANLLEVQNNAGTTTYMSVDSTGVFIDGKLTVTGLIDPPALVVDEQPTAPYNSSTTLTGSVSVLAGTPNVVGIGAMFSSEVSPGDYLRIAGEIHRVLSVTDDITLTLETNHVAGAASVLAYRLGDKGSIWIKSGGPASLMYTDNSGVDSDIVIVSPSGTSIDNDLEVTGDITLGGNLVTGSSIEYIFPTVAPVVGQRLEATGINVVDGVTHVTLSWATP